MKINHVLLYCLFVALFHVSFNLYGEAFLSELINNAEEDLCIKINGNFDDKFEVVKLFSLPDNTRIQHPTPLGSRTCGGTNIGKKTRAIFDGLSIPKWGSLRDSNRDKKYHRGICIAFSSYQSTIERYFHYGPYCCPPRKNEHFYGGKYTSDNIIIVYQSIGGFLTIETFGFNLWSISLPDGSIIPRSILDNNLGSTHQTSIKMKDGDKYSIELSTFAHKFLNVAIKENDISTSSYEPWANPKAYVKSFSNADEQNKIRSAVVGFDQVVTTDFFSRFYKMVQKDPYLCLNNEVKAGNDQISFRFGTPTYKSYFQAVIDELNTAVL